MQTGGCVVERADPLPVTPVNVSMVNCADRRTPSSVINLVEVVTTDGQLRRANTSHHSLKPSSVTTSFLPTT
jgi:hypothetical protein